MQKLTSLLSHDLDHQSWHSGDLGLRNLTHQVSWSFDGVVMTQKKNLISQLPQHMTIKIGKKVTYGEGTQPAKSNDILTRWSRDIFKILYLHFLNIYDHQT